MRTVWNRREPVALYSIRPHRDRQYSEVLFAGHHLGTGLWLILFFDSRRAASRPTQGVKAKLYKSVSSPSLLTRISIYSQRGESSEEIRLLYMNEVAYSTWKAMGKDPHVIGSQHRPPTTASLTFGVPFSD